MLLKIHFLERAGGTDRIQEILIHLSVRVISCIPRQTPISQSLAD